MEDFGEFAPIVSSPVRDLQADSNQVPKYAEIIADITEESIFSGVLIDKVWSPDTLFKWELLRIVRSLFNYNIS